MYSDLFTMVVIGTMDRDVYSANSKCSHFIYNPKHLGNLHILIMEKRVITGFYRLF